MSAATEIEIDTSVTLTDDLPSKLFIFNYTRATKSDPYAGYILVDVKRDAENNYSFSPVSDGHESTSFYLHTKAVLIKTTHQGRQRRI